MGIVVGSDISVISQIEGNFVVAVKETRIGLASEYVKRIIVYSEFDIW